MTSPNELPLLDHELRCMDCTTHTDTPWPTSPPTTMLIVKGDSAVYEGAGEVPGPHFRRQCQYCGCTWPEAVH